MLETVYVGVTFGDMFKMLVADSMHSRSHEHNDSATDILNFHREKDQDLGVQGLDS